MNRVGCEEPLIPTRPCHGGQEALDATGKEMNKDQTAFYCVQDLQVDQD